MESLKSKIDNELNEEIKSIFNLEPVGLIVEMQACRRQRRQKGMLQENDKSNMAKKYNSTIHQ